VLPCASGCGRAPEADAPGAAVALVADGRTVLAAGVGHRDLGRSRPLGAGGRCYAYSITKVFLAVAALRLAEQRLSSWMTRFGPSCPTCPWPSP
jgi:CubicO group peptidase (beta-lactamase class C family)